MFFISLPYFYENQKFNIFFKNYINNNQEKLIALFDIDYVHGSFPWSYWNGNINSHDGKMVLLSEMKNIINSYQIPIVIDQSNLLINNNDFYDTYEKTVDSLINNCEISNLHLINLISQNTNPNMNFWISNKIQYIEKVTNEDINNIISQGFISFFVTNEDKNYKNKNKIRILLNDCFLCQQQKECIIKENISIYNFSNISHISECISNTNYEQNYFKLITPFLQNGYNYFKLDTVKINLETFNKNIIKSFIKPEYIGECLYEYINYER